VKYQANPPATRAVPPIIKAHSLLETVLLLSIKLAL